MRLWKERGTRFVSRTREKVADINRGINWYIRGGERFFDSYTPELLSAHKWCFIVCCNNSGSSLLQTILENSGQVSAMPHEGQRYTKTLARAHRRRYERVWSEFIADLRMTESNSLECLPRLVHDWMSILKSPVKDVVLEKTTANAVRMRWLQKAFPNSYFIGLVRNGYAVTEGIKRKGKKSVYRGARHWNYVNKTMIQDSKLIKNYLELKYEDMVDDLENTSLRIGEFLGIDDSMIYDAMKGQFNFITISSLKKQPINNMNIESIGRLTKSDISCIENEAGEMLEYYSYKAK